MALGEWLYSGLSLSPKILSSILMACQNFRLTIESTNLSGQHVEIMKAAVVTLCRDSPTSPIISRSQGARISRDPLVQASKRCRSGFQKAPMGSFCKCIRGKPFSMHTFFINKIRAAAIVVMSCITRTVSRCHHSASKDSHLFAVSDQKPRKNIRAGQMIRRITRPRGVGHCRYPCTTAAFSPPECTAETLLFYYARLRATRRNEKW